MPMTIYPYLLYDTTWVFDDERTGLKAEAFVSGMTDMISRLVEQKGIPNAGSGFSLTFGDEPFDGHDAELHWTRADGAQSLMGGNWYAGRIAGELMEGWLCPALFCFFATAPQRLFVRAEALPPGVDPIWHAAPDDSRPRRFMGPEDK